MDFISKFLKYRVILKPRKTRMNAFGEKYLEEGVNVRFSEGRYSTEDQEIIALLTSNPRYGIDFTSPDAKPGVLTSVAEASLKSESAAKQTINTSCPHCQFKAASEFGLKSHIRAKHEKK